MFEVGFSELCMVALVALLVIGPEKLPKIARLAGFWVGKMRTMVTKVKAEINEELKAEEMRELLKEQRTGLNEFQKDLDKLSGKLSVSLSEVKDMNEPKIKTTQK